MKKIIYILVALMAFVCGIFVFYIRPLYITVPLNEINKDVSLYKSQQIKVKGYLEVTGGETSFLYSLVDYKNINSEEYAPFPGISLKVSEEIEAENISFIKEIAEKNSMLSELGKVEKYRKQLQGVFLAEVEITGYVEEEKNEIFGSYYPIIRIEKLKQLSPVKFIYIKELEELKNEK